MRDAALSWAGAGWPLLPVMPVVANGAGWVCSCPRGAECKSPGKHPLIRVGDGLEAATTNLEQVAEWWTRWPDANIAMACAGAGVVVLDCDLRDTGDGEIELLTWLESHGTALPETFTVRTGSGGRHFYLLHPPGERIKSGKLLSHVDIKSLGYVLLPPSLHVLGTRYEIKNAVAVAPMSDDLATLLRGARRAPSRAAGQDPSSAEHDAPPLYDYKRACVEGPRSGSRDHFFNARAFELRRLGWTQDEAAAEMKRLWDLCEQPVGDEYGLEEVAEKLRRAWRTVDPEPDAVVVSWPAGEGVDGGEPAHVEPQVEPHEPPPDGPDVPPDARGKDVANAERLVELVQGRWIWTSALGWCRYRLGRWEPDDTDEIFEAAKEVQRRMVLKAADASVPEDDRARWLKLAHEAATAPRLRAMVEVAHSDPRLAVSVTKLDQDGWVLPVGNGTVDLRTGQLRHHDPGDWATMGSEVIYAPDERAARRWEAYLAGTLGDDPDLEAYVRKVCGSALVGKVREKALYVVVGPPDAGKTTLMNVLQTVLGDLAMFMAPEHLMMGRAGQGSVIPQHETARMRGKRLVVSDEPQRGGRWAEGLIKQLTGDDTVTGAFKYKNSFEMTPSWSLMVAANTVPNVRDQVLASRVRIVPVRAASRRDPEVREESRDPASPLVRGALAWAIRGCLEWQREGGVGTSVAVELASEEYRKDQDSVGEFVAGLLAEEAGARTVMKQVYGVYSRWSEERGEHPMSQRSLQDALRERGLTVERDGRQVVLWGWVLQADALLWPGQSV